MVGFAKAKSLEILTLIYSIRVDVTKFYVSEIKQSSPLNGKPHPNVLNCINQLFGKCENQWHLLKVKREISYAPAIVIQPRRPPCTGIFPDTFLVWKSSATQLILIPSSAFDSVPTTICLGNLQGQQRGISFERRCDGEEGIRFWIKRLVGLYTFPHG